MKIRTVSIIGVGLIGGSLGMALKKSHRVRKVIGIGRHPEKLKKALKMKAVDEITTDFPAGVRDADLVVVCTPVGLIAPTIKRILPALKKSCVITDVGSVKAPITAAVSGMLARRNIFFVGGHPMAGSEQFGIEHARASLFKGATWILTPGRNTPPAVLAELRSLVKSTGARILTLAAGSHDRIASATSHLPHLLAAALVNLIERRSRRDKHTNDLIAGSFRDLTRIASSKPEIWQEIFSMNRQEIIRATREYEEIVKNILQSLRTDRKQELLRMFGRAKKTRDRMFTQDAADKN